MSSNVRISIPEEEMSDGIGVRRHVPVEVDVCKRLRLGAEDGDGGEDREDDDEGGEGARLPPVGEGGGAEAHRHVTHERPGGDEDGERARDLPVGLQEMDQLLHSEMR